MFWNSLNQMSGYTQLIENITRLTPITKIIDHIFSNRTQNISGSDVIENIPLSDHFITFEGIKINFKTKFTRPSPQTIKYRDWNDLNYDKLAKHFEGGNLPTLYCNECYNSHNFCIRFDKNIPIRRRRIEANNMQPWLNYELKSLIRERDIKYKLLMDSIKNDDDIDFYTNICKSLRNKVVFELKKAKKRYYYQPIENNSKNPKKLWAVISKIIPTKKCKKSKTIENLNLNDLNDLFAT